MQSIQQAQGKHHVNGDTPPIPKELTERKAWVNWNWEYRKGKWTKEPYDPDSTFRASTTDPRTWATFEAAVLSQKALNRSGIGIVFAEEDTLAGVDLDDCRNPETGEIDPDAQAIIDEQGSYTEVSPSGTGVKMFLFGMKPNDGCKTGNTPWGGHIEIYDSGRFFAVTGNHLEGTPAKVLARQKAFKSLYERFFGGGDTAVALSATAVSPLTDDELIAEAERISKDKFRRLFYGGDISDYGNDHSSGRAALIGLLRWYAHDDAEQIERIMRRSALDRSRFDEKRGAKSFLRYEIDRLIEKRLRSYYEPNGEIVSVDLKDPPSTEKKTSVDGGDSEIVSVEPPPLNGQKRILPVKTVQDVLDECGDKPDWLWHGFLARGWFTDLTGPAKKAGKTTLLMHAVRHLLDGTPFLDYPTQATKVLYLTEQSASAAEAFKNSGLDTRHENLKIIQWKDTREWSWPRLVEDVFGSASDFGASLVIVDTLNKFAGLKGEEENLAGPVSEAMNPLLLAAQRHNIAVLSVRHANKEGKARGSTQFDHDVDILFEIQRADGNENTRVLEGIGRSDDVPAKLTVELRPDGGGYRNLGGDDKVKFRRAVRVVMRAVSKDARNPTPKPELERVFKEEGVALTTGREAARWLVDKGGLIRTGEGKRNDPHAFHAVAIDASAIPEAE